MRKKLGFTILLTISLSLLNIKVPVATAVADGYTTVTLTPSEDGYIQNSTGTFTKYSTGNDLEAQYESGTPLIKRAYIRWNTSSIPDGAWIYRLEFLIDGHDGGGSDPGYRFTNMTSDPVGAGNQTIYDAVAAGDTLLGNTSRDYTDVTYTLGDEHDDNCTNFQNALQGGKDWFALGIYSLDESVSDNRWRIYSSESGQTPVPSLRVHYYDGAPYTYGFTGAYYENGTAYGSPVTVTCSSPSLEVTVDGNTSYIYSNTSATMFSWDIGGGYTRRIYAAGSENFTVTVPDDTVYTYSFTVKDYTGKSGEGDTFLEAYKSINGTEELVERGKLLKGNAVPLNLQFGSTYHLKVLWADDTRYDWGYFVATSDQTVNIIVDEMEFTDKAQTLWQWVTVESSRPSGSQITVEYLDNRTNTEWLNISIRVRGGSVVFTENNSDTDSKTTIWNGANSSLAYVVSVTVEHSDFGESGATFIHDPTYSFPAAPSFSGIFTFEGLALDSIIAWIVSISVGAFSFSQQWKRVAGVATMSVATLLAFFGFGGWSFYLLAFGWYVALLIVLAGGREA